MLGSTFQRESTVKWRTYWIPFPNNRLAHSIWVLPAHPLPLFHSKHYFSVPWEFLPSRVYLKGSTLVGLQAYLNYTASHAAKKPKPVLEPVKPPSATLFSEHEQVPWYSPMLIPAGPHISVRLRLTKELCVPTGWYARFVQNTAYLRIIKADTKIDSALLLVSLCLFLSWCSSWFLIGIAVIALSVLPIHTAPSLPRQR